MHKYLLGRNKEDQAMLSLVVSIRRMRGNGHKLNTKEISFKPKTILFFFTVRVAKHPGRLSRESVEPPSVETLEP